MSSRSNVYTYRCFILLSIFSGIAVKFFPEHSTVSTDGQKHLCGQSAWTAATRKNRTGTPAAIPGVKTCMSTLEPSTQRPYIEYARALYKWTANEDNEDHNKTENQDLIGHRQTFTRYCTRTRDNTNFILVLSSFQILRWRIPNLCLNTREDKDS